jgi:polysaccharide pyruvyl transferase WcaK-like protein
MQDLGDGMRDAAFRLSLHAANSSPSSSAARNRTAVLQPLRLNLPSESAIAAVELRARAAALTHARRLPDRRRRRQRRWRAGPRGRWAAPWH